MIQRLHEWEEKCVQFIERRLPRCAPHVRKYQRLLRYLLAGGTAAAVDFWFLYFFTDVLRVHYLSSSIFAFLIAFVVSFTLQKFWTFQDTSIADMQQQITFYFIVATINLGVNTVLMYVFVDWFRLWYVLAQVIASGIIACESFFISRMLFTRKTA